MANATRKTTKSSQNAGAGTTAKSYQDAFPSIFERLNNIASNYASGDIIQAFAMAGMGMANLATIQNQRVKAINPLPADYTKDDLGEFLRKPELNEMPLRQVTEGLRWTAYPVEKLIKSYADMLTYRHYVIPQYIADSEQDDTFLREWRLVDQIEKKFKVKENGQPATQQALAQGKVFYILRYDIDKVHNRVNTVFFQQLPTQWSRIIGFNNISRYTISFDMTYFLQPGTDYTQYGDLFEPYLRDFDAVFGDTVKGNKPSKGTYYYASEPETERVIPIKIGKRTFNAHIDRLNANGVGSPKMFQQNGRWCYYVSLPIDRVWTFEIDSSTAIAVTPFAGLLQTFARQANFEEAQLSLVINPLLKLFTGEVPYDKDEGATARDKFMLTHGAIEYFKDDFMQLMQATQTAGAALYIAPLQNIKSHDFAESSIANGVSSSFLQYGFEKAGLTALIPVTDKPSQGTAEVSAKLEAQFAKAVYSTLTDMFNYLLYTLNLKYSWQIHIFGDVYSEAQMRADALKQLDKGDLSQHFVLAALDGITILDRLSMCRVIKGSKLIDLLTPPATSYTQSAQSKKPTEAATVEGGAPTKTEQEKEETKTIKQTAGEVAEE